MRATQMEQLAVLPWEPLIHRHATDQADPGEDLIASRHRLDGKDPSNGAQEAAVEVVITADSEQAWHG